MRIVIVVHFLTLIESWVNNWCAEEGIPALLDKDALLRTQLITSDDDPLLHGAFQSVVCMEVFFRVCTDFVFAISFTFKWDLLITIALLNQKILLFLGM